MSHQGDSRSVLVAERLEDRRLTQELEGESDIGQAPQQPRRPAFTRRRPQRLDEQQPPRGALARVAACPSFARFLGDEPHQHREPLGGAHVHQRRQLRHQQRRVGRVEGEPAAELPYVGATTVGSIPASSTNSGNNLASWHIARSADLSIACPILWPFPLRGQSQGLE